MKTQAKILISIFGLALAIIFFQKIFKDSSHVFSTHRNAGLQKEQFLENNAIKNDLNEASSRAAGYKTSVEEENENIKNILSDFNQVRRMEDWNGVVLFVKADPKNNLMIYHHYNSDYRDSNSNGVQDDQDEGFFNPASTVKVSIAALVLEKLNYLGVERGAEYRELGSKQWYSIFSDLEAALVISSNEATNRLILFLGFDFIRESLRSKGFENLSINRLMLDQGTHLSSPAFEIKYDGSIIFQPPQEAASKIECFEAKDRIGNCASAADLVGVMARIVGPEHFPEKANFHFRDEDRFWLQEIMAKTPREAGFGQEDNFCRFLQPLYEKKAFKSGRMLSKCGVGLFSHSYIDTSYIQTDDGESYYTVFAIQPPRYISKEEATEWMNEVSELILSEL